MAPFVVVLGSLGALWWRLNGRMDTLDAKIDRLNTLLTDTLVALNRYIGELKGALHSPTTWTERGTARQPGSPASCGSWPSALSA